MGKYIDSEKLIAEIQDRRREFINKGEQDLHDAEIIRRSAISSCNELLSLITSLRQEQQEPSGYDKALLEVKSKVDELYEEASIGLSEYDSGLYNGIAETCMKLRGFIKARLDSEEQPEVDLEKEIEEW